MPELIASALLFCLILIPYFAYRDVAAALGEDTLSKLLFKGLPPQNEVHADSLAEAVERLRDLDSGQPR